MQTDTYTKFILTLIALCLVVLAWETLDNAMAPPAQAQAMPMEPTAYDAKPVYCSGAPNGCLPVKIYK